MRIFRGNVSISFEDHKGVKDEHTVAIKASDLQLEVIAPPQRLYMLLDTSLSINVTTSINL